MTLFSIVLSVALGWIAVAMIVATAVLPYVLRPTALTRALGLAGSLTGALVERMRPHAWLGYAVVALSVFHAVAAVVGGSSRVDPVGLWFAVFALVLLSGQWLLGSRLMQRKVEQRQRLRRWHFGTMVGSCAAVFAHAYLNGALLRMFFP